jgi:hypothetical protein
MNLENFKQAYVKTISESANDSDLKNYIRSIVEEVLVEQDIEDAYDQLIDYYNGGEGYDDAQELRDAAENGTKMSDLIKMLKKQIRKNFGNKIRLDKNYEEDLVSNVIYPAKVSEARKDFMKNVKPLYNK